MTDEHELTVDVEATVLTAPVSDQERKEFQIMTGVCIVLNLLLGIGIGFFMGRALDWTDGMKAVNNQRMEVLRQSLEHGCHYESANGDHCQKCADEAIEWAIMESMR